MMLCVKCLFDPAVYPHNNLRVHCFPFLLPACKNVKHRLTAEKIRHRHPEAEVDPLPAVLTPESTVFERFPVRTAVDSTPNILHRHLPDQNTLLQHLQHLANPLIQLMHLHNDFPPVSSPDPASKLLFFSS